MTELGGYELVREVQRSALGSVWTARQAGSAGPAAFAVKRSQPDPEVLGVEHANRVLQVFLNTVEALERAGRGCKGFAPVLARGVREDGAFWVTHWCARGSAEKLVVTRAAIDAADLDRVVRSAATALKGYWEACGRGHGNLKASNVLIRGEADVADCEILLTDPLPDDEADAARDMAADVRSLGEIIHRLVTRQPPGDRVGRTVRDGPEWEALGKSGPAWRDLCERLVSPDPTAGPASLDEIIEAIPSASASGSGRGKLAGLAVAAVVLLGGGAATYFVMTQGKQATNTVSTSGASTGKAWLEFARGYQSVHGIFQSLNGEVPDRDGKNVRRADLYTRDPNLQGIVEAAPKFAANAQDSFYPSSMVRLDRVERLLHTRISTETNQQFEERMAGYAAAAGPRLERARLALASVRATITKWPARREIAERAKAWEGRGWSQASRAVAQVIDPLKTFDSWDTVDAESANGYKAAADATLSAMDWIVLRGMAIKQAEDAWAESLEAGESLKRVGDPLLARFGEWVQSEARRLGSESTSADVGEFAKSMGAMAELGRRLQAFVGGEFERVDGDEWAKSPVLKLLSSASVLNPKSFEDWMQEAVKADFRILDASADPTLPWPKNPPNAGAQRELAAARDEIQQLGGNAAESLKDESVRLAALEARAKEVGEKPWSRATRAEKEKSAGEVVQDATKLVDAIQSRRRAEVTKLASSREQLEKQREGLRGLPFPDARLQAAWSASLRRMDADADRLKEAVTAASARHASLKRLEEVTPTWTARESPWAGDFARAAASERDRAIAGVVNAWQGGLPPDSPAEPDSIGKAGEDYATARKGLETLDAALRGISDALSLAYSPAEPRSEAPTIQELSAEARKNPGFDLVKNAPSVRAVIDALEESERVERANAAGSLDAIGKGSSPSAIVSLWRRRASLDGWPATMNDLITARASLESAAQTIDAIADVERKRKLRAEAETLAQASWRRGAATARTVEEFRQALSLRAAYRMDTDVALNASETPESVRYNAALLALLAKLKPDVGVEPTDEQSRAALEEFAGQFAGAAPGAAGAVLGEVRSLLDAREDPTPKVDLTRLGPGSVGWICDNPEGDTLVFVSPGGVRLAFARLPDAGDAPAAYIGLTEVPIAVVTDLCRRDRAACEQLALAFEAQAGENLKNFTTQQRLRGWHWRGNAFEPREVWQDEEMWRKVRDFYAADARREAPTSQSPIQAIGPADAVLIANFLGCRLPTRDEHLRSRALGDAGNANLRDETWSKHLAHVIRQRANPLYRGANTNEFVWPDSNGFWIDGPPRLNPRESLATAGTGNDETLWFREVPTNPTKPVDLVGNAAEYVLTSEVRPGASTWEAAKNAVKNAAGAVAVIGASAISPPTVDPLKAEPCANEARNNLGYADTGMRLAFTAEGAVAPRPSLAKRAGELLNQDEAFWLAGR
ncbi:MAG: hypothetical protein ACKVW3_07620 [Phycisphaerales bacterium]